MKKLIAFGILFQSLSLFASERCFRIAENEGVWSRTPELLCVEEDSHHRAVVVELKLQEPRETTTLATFNLDILRRARCGPSCNGDVYGVNNPSNSAFKVLKFTFDGKRPVGQDEQGGLVSYGLESGKVSFGGKTFFYEELELNQETSVMETNSQDNFSCPKIKRINCMPVVTEKFVPYCKGPYHWWIRANCPEVQFFS